MATTNPANDPKAALMAHLAGATDALLATTYRTLFDNTTYLDLDQAGRYVAMALGSELSRRNSDLDAALEAWVDDLESEATYESVVLDYLTTRGL